MCVFFFFFLFLLYDVFTCVYGCAVQVQYPGAERVMMSDLRNLKVLAWFLQKFELDFDILSSLRELSKQIKGEFDFRWAFSEVLTDQAKPQGSGGVGLGWVGSGWVMTHEIRVMSRVRPL